MVISLEIYNEHIPYFPSTVAVWNVSQEIYKFPNTVRSMNLMVSNNVKRRFKDLRGVGLDMQQLKSNVTPLNIVSFVFRRIMNLSDLISRFRDRTNSDLVFKKVTQNVSDSVITQTSANTLTCPNLVSFARMYKLYIYRSQVQYEKNDICQEYTDGAHK